MDEKIEKLANALLYEGYALFPYRQNALKNKKRFNFGVLSPKIWVEKQTNEHFFAQSEFFVEANDGTPVDFKIRFLRLTPDSEWQTANEQVISGTIKVGDTQTLEFKEENLFGKIELTFPNTDSGVRKLHFKFQNLSYVSNAALLSREAILEHSFVSAHVMFEIESGSFVSLLEPPDSLAQMTNSLENIGLFPVLVGDKMRRNVILASPIVLYDFPEIAENSLGDYFDGLEIDELMVLSLLALTDDEKRQAAATDERIRSIIERIEGISADELKRLHAHLR
jgi:hypothetical protein